MRALPITSVFKPQFNPNPKRVDHALRPGIASVQTEPHLSDEEAESMLTQGCFYGLKGYHEAAKEWFLKATNGKEAIAGEAHLNLGVIFLQEKNYDKALHELNKALVEFEEAPIPKHKCAQIYLYRCVAHFNKGMFAVALKDGHTASNLDPKNGEIYFCLGRIYDKLERLKEAGINYRRAIQYGFPIEDLE